jgi:hypothetical protein
MIQDKAEIKLFMQPFFTPRISKALQALRPKDYAIYIPMSELFMIIILTMHSYEPLGHNLAYSQIRSATGN